MNKKKPLQKQQKLLKLTTLVTDKPKEAHREGREERVTGETLRLGVYHVSKGWDFCAPLTFWRSARRLRRHTQQCVPKCHGLAQTSRTAHVGYYEIQSIGEGELTTGRCIWLPFIKTTRTVDFGLGVGSNEGLQPQQSETATGTELHASWKSPGRAHSKAVSKLHAEKKFWRGRKNKITWLVEKMKKGIQLLFRHFLHLQHFVTCQNVFIFMSTKLCVISQKSKARHYLF